MSGTTRQNEMIDSLAVPIPMIPVRWIDTEPAERREKPCTISSLDLEVHVSGLYADVTQTMVISNPNKRDLSVDISIPMPDRAVVRGYALDIDGQMIDGVVVPKEKARMAFETEQRIGADPGLVEAVKGNVYRTRVYPVPARKTRTVRLRYVAPLLVVDGQAAFLDAPMPAERLGERKVRIDVELLDCPKPELSGINDARFLELGTCWSVEACESDVEPGSGIRVALPKLPAAFCAIERDPKGTVWFTASEKAPLPAGEAPAITSLAVLWDVSGSRAAMSHEGELELLRSYCVSESIKSYRLVAFSDRAEDVLAFDDADELLRHIGSLRYDGGSDFQALASVLDELPQGDGADACVIFTDGMDTLSGEAISFPQGLKVLAVVSGKDRDFESLRQACAGLAFDLAAAPKTAEELAQMLLCPSFLSGIQGEGVADVLGIGSGADGRYTVVGRLAVSVADIAFANTGTVFSLDSKDARRGSTISHAWAAQRVALLSPRADENADELLELGRRFGVVSPATSLLVLETLDQWLRYDIKPPISWRSMYLEWKRQRRRMMLISSDEELVANHLRNLRREWAELLGWWKRDYADPRSARWGVGLFCTTCGTTVERGTRLCPTCGAPIHELNISFRESTDRPRRRSARGSSTVHGGSSDDFAYDDLFSEPMADSVEESSEVYYAMECSAPAFAMADHAAECSSEGASSSDGGSSGGDVTPTGPTVTIQAWMPDADYLDALDEALDSGFASVQEAYYQQRDRHVASPSFYIDCAGWFMANGEEAFGLRVLTNLAELRIEDAALLRVMAWRLREAGELERSLSVLRRVLKLRPEDSQSHRDIALVLDELARKAFASGDEDAAREYAEEAGRFYRKTALTPWQRRPMAIGLFAVEEYNVLRAWADAQTWDTAPKLELLGEGLGGVLDCDLRITLAWDADETDIDIHVTEPSGVEAYYGHRRTSAGGRVSEDITDGYGPELYEIRKARDGIYTIRAHYFASHQQTLFGPASCTLTVYTDWGRPTQHQQVTSTRLDNERQMIHVGTAAYGSAACAEAEGEPADEGRCVVDITKGSSISELIAAYGTPSEGDPEQLDGHLVWRLPSGRVRIATIVDGKVERVIEHMPWGEEMVIVQ